MSTDDALKDQVLDAVLPNVAFDGWTARAVRHGVEDHGLAPGSPERAFPDGVTGMIRYWSARSDRRMAADLANLLATADPVSMRLSQRVATAVRLRILTDGADREAVRRTLAHLALPGNAALGAELLYRTCDAIWHAAGDRSVDFSYYTKRASLAAVYAATVLYWLEDQSEDSIETWGFLERRIADLGLLPRLRSRFDQAIRSALAPLAGLRRPGFSRTPRP